MSFKLYGFSWTTRAEVTGPKSKERPWLQREVREKNVHSPGLDITRHWWEECSRIGDNWWKPNVAWWDNVKPGIRGCIGIEEVHMLLHAVSQQTPKSVHRKIRKSPEKYLFCCRPVWGKQTATWEGQETPPISFSSNFKQNHCLTLWGEGQLALLILENWWAVIALRVIE